MREVAQILEEARRRGIGRRLAASEVLIGQDEIDDSVFVLVEGSLSVSRRHGSGTVSIGEIDQPGTVVGEMVAFGGGHRSATVTANSDSEVVQLSRAEFEGLLTEHPDVAGRLATQAVQRAEEAGLAELMQGHFGLEEDALGAVMQAVTWHRLAQGEVLFEEGDPSDAIYFVVRGRLLASRFDPDEGRSVRLGEAERGEVVGENGLLRGAPRSATITALRDSVLAGMSEEAFFDMIERRPRTMIQVALNALDRLEGANRSAPSTVLAVAVADGISADWVTKEIRRSLEPFGSVVRLLPEEVDRLLDAEDASEAAGEEVGAVRLSRLLHEAEMGTDHLVLDVGRRAGNWSQRCMGMADRLLVLVGDQSTDAQREQLKRILDGCPTRVHRTLVVVHGTQVSAPGDTRSLMEFFSTQDALHMRADSAEDMARVARVATGRGRALVLSGGGGRGFAHLGVQRALEELGFPIDIVGGTSVGGILAAVIADGMSPVETVEWARSHFPSALDYTLPVVSLVKAERIARAAVATFGERQIEDLWRPHFCVSTNLSGARPFVHRTGSVVLAIRATSAIPGVMPPVPHGRDLLVDGGVLNNLPIDVARELAPAGMIVAVDVAPPRGPGAPSDYGLSVSGWNALRAGLRKKKRTYPGISAVLMRSMITASMQERDRQIRAGFADCYLDLEVRGTSMLDFRDPAGVALRGYEAAMPRLEAFLAESEKALRRGS